MPRKLPKISVCIPTYNQSLYLRECVHSALNQTLENIEVVVSVNHCTDNTEEILSEFCDSRLKVMKPDKFLPGADNFKFCVAQSHGPYFNLLPSDDALLPDFAESQAKILDKYPNVTFVHSAAQIIDRDGKLTSLEKSIHKSFVRKGSEELKRYIEGSRCVGNSALIRRSAYNAVNGFGDLFTNDWELWIRLLQFGDVAYNEKILVKYRVWMDKEGKRKARYLDHIKSIVDFYDIYQPAILNKYPNWKKIFERARLRKALSAVDWLVHFDISLRKEAVPFILQLSNSWSVRLKLSLFDLGLGPLWTWKKWLRSWARQRVKALLYPKVPTNL